MGNILAFTKNIKRFSAIIILVAAFSGTSIVYASSDAQIASNVSPSIAPSGTCHSPSVSEKGYSPKVTVTPCYNLAARTKVTVDGTGFTPNQTGSVIECNGANQPVTDLYGLSKYPIPVSCTSPVNDSAYQPNFNSSGDFISNIIFTIISYPINKGVTGPPTVGGNAGSAAQEKKAAAEAQGYPCAPKDSQIAGGAYLSFTGKKIANGDYCEITVGDNSTDQLSTSAPIFFALSPPTTLRATPLSSGAVHLSWTSSTGGVTFDQAANKIEPLTYYIYRVGSSSPVRITPSLALTSAYNYPGLKKGAHYDFYIIAHDYKGFTSSRSALARS